MAVAVEDHRDWMESGGGRVIRRIRTIVIRQIKISKIPVSSMHTLMAQFWVIQTCELTF
ncbi:MAG: hypothetical protein HKM93_17025 [Desulfobacteraceae bacterium]|nr:hypothetical protein [Desulfobacteraceae bacterium]